MDDIIVNSLKNLLEQGPLVIVLVGCVYYMKNLSDRERDERLKNQETFVKLLSDNNNVIRDNTKVVQELNQLISKLIK